jgi:hypothetical protein
LIRVNGLGVGFWAAIAAGLCWPVFPANAQTKVDLQLVLAVDASGSVDEAEYALQMSGIAAAFRDPQVLAAIAKGYHGRIAVALVTWAESAEPKDASPWHVVADPAGAERFARLAERFPRRVIGGTGIGRALFFSMRLIEASGFKSTRRVVDLSGDGTETPTRYFSVDAPQAKARARASGITINGLAILTDEPELEAYYRNRVISGPGAFAMAAASYGAIAEALRRKLIREIEYRPDVSRLLPRAAPARRPARGP